MNRIVGSLVLLLVLYALILASSPRPRPAAHHQRIAERLALCRVLTIGAGFRTISGRVDLAPRSAVGPAPPGSGPDRSRSMRGPPGHPSPPTSIAVSPTK